jgi:hypothetical protein
MGAVTAADAVLTITIPLLFPTPVQIQGFASDDAFDIPQLKSAEVMMGVDGLLSAGFVFVAIPQQISLQGDSLSNDLFDIWWAQMQASKATYQASGQIILPAISKKYALRQGTLTGYKPAPAVKKLLQPRQHEITWAGFAASPL